MPTPTRDADAGPPKATATPTPGPTPRPVPGHLIPVAPAQIIEVLRPLVGLKETPKGSNRGPLIDEFNRSANTELGSPWCAAVAHWAYHKNGADDRPGAYSPSWFKASRRVALKDVRPGDVGLVYFPSMGRYAHTIAAVEKVIVSAGRVVQVQTLEGNTNAQNSREGDQFARRVRAADTLTFVRWTD